MNSKTNKGITLIALVITIIVLLILAGVTISMVLGDDGIIAQAQSAKKAQEKAEGKDEGAISSAEGVISRYSMGKYDASKNSGIATQNSTINGEKASSTNPVIPKGFKAISTADDSKVTSTWGTSTVDDGLVIQDEAGNQFVWVPVDGTEVKLELKYYEECYEPDIITGSAMRSGDKLYNYPYGTEYDGDETNRNTILEDGYDKSINGLLKQFKDEYNSMVESVNTYGGFYVGRYETSWTGIKVASVATTNRDQIFTAATLLETTWSTSNPSTENKATWYGLYAKQKELYKKNSSSSVVSGMIYGCQWDAIMDWMKDVPNGDEKFIDNSFGMGNYTGGSKNTGSSDAYRVKNIYDLGGNYSEYTQTAKVSSYRVSRGGMAAAGNTSGSAAQYHWGNSTTTFASSSRLQLYIK